MKNLLDTLKLEQLKQIKIVELDKEEIIFNEGDFCESVGVVISGEIEITGAEAWRRGDLEEYGRLSFQSGWSSIHNWESGAPEQSKLYEIMTETDGIYGGRFSGAGFKGCCIALINPDKAESIAEEVERKYLAAFPEMKGKYCFRLCESADGLGAIL